MIRFPWRRRRQAARLEAQQALLSADRQLAAARAGRATSEQRKLRLAEIRRQNHFTPSIFPEGKRI